MSVHRAAQTSQNVDELEFIIDNENTILTKQVSFEETSYQLYVTSTLQTESGEIQVLCESLSSNSREKFNLDQMNVMLDSCRSLRTERDATPSTEEIPDQEQEVKNNDSGIIPDNDQDNRDEPTAVEQAPLDPIDEPPTQAVPEIAPTPTTRQAQPTVERPPQRRVVTPEPEPEPEPEPVVVEAPAPAALAPPPYHATITVAGGTANLRCGDGQSPEIPSTQTLTFSSQQSCAIVIGDAMGALTVDHTGSWTCALSGAYVICSE
jgi:D-tyrosyl-tRNA(Tyr) deacylase